MSKSSLLQWFWSLFTKSNPLSDKAVSSREIKLNEYEKERVDQSRPAASERRDEP